MAKQESGGNHLMQEKETEYIEFITKDLAKPIAMMAVFLIISTVLFLLFA